MEMDGAFRAVVEHLDLAEIDRREDVVYFLDAELRIRGYNASYVRFARENGGAELVERFGVGAEVMAAVDGEKVREFYRWAYRVALTTGKPFTHEYECSSPEVFRSFQQTAYPLAQKAGLLVSHHKLVERPMGVAGQAFTQEYVDEKGLIVMCAHCRRVRHGEHKNRWDWVPELVRRVPMNTSHTFCPPCFSFHYGPYMGKEHNAG